jgi:peptidyl-Lys metalloendopeptidase
MSSSVAFSGRCSATQQSTILSAVAAASTYANGANTYLGGISSGTQRYTTWFGAFTTARGNTAKTHFSAIKDAFDNKPIVVDCKCRKSYYAYVYPNQPYKIYVCNAFWSAPMTGTDSKAGTLIHEMSHFTVVAGTDDWAYGQTAAKSLAFSDPAKALDNADSHEYFAENTPAQP